tara:strand:- start:1531 stop:2337 length:807 start_codon:yes stop_codon:yes gene_type:complete
MTDTETAAMSSAEDSVSKEAYDQLKKQLDQKSEDLAAARARTDVYEQKERTRIAAFQPAAKEFISELMGEADIEAKTDLSPLSTWADEYTSKTDIMSQAPLARLVSCASAKLKRTREEASVNAEAAKTLSATMQENEQLKAELASTRQRLTETQTLSDERQVGLEKLQGELAKAGLMNDKFDFSKATSREKNANPEADSSTTTSFSSGKAPELKSTEVNASRNTDHLLAEIWKRGAGALRVTSSGTSHALLGASNTTDGDLMAVLRAY